MLPISESFRKKNLETNEKQQNQISKYVISIQAS